MLYVFCVQTDLIKKTEYHILMCFHVTTVTAQNVGEVQELDPNTEWNSNNKSFDKRKRKLIYIV